MTSTKTTTSAFISVSSPEEDEAFRDLDKKLNGAGSNFSYLAVTPEEDEAFEVLAQKTGAPTVFPQNKL